MNSPFGSSNQGGFRQQPQQQNFGQQGGFGVQTAGTFGGFQPQQQSFGFGGGQGFGGFQPQQSFGGFGGGQGFGGFNPFQGGYGGFQPQQQFNPFQGGYGGGFQPQGFGGGFNPMFGGIGGLGFNPMMGPQFGMPMQGFNPYQIQMMDKKRQFEQQQFNADQTPVMGDMMYRGGRDMLADFRDMRSAENKQRQFEQQQFNPYQQQFQPQQQVSAPWMPTITETPGFGDWQQKQKQWVDQTPEGISYIKANEALEAFKKANPNPFSYSEFFGGDPALRAQHAQLYGEYQKAASPYYNKLNEYEKTNPFSPTAQQPQSPFTGPQRSAQDILNMAVGNTPKDMQYDLNKDGKITSADALAYQRQYGAQPQQPSNGPDSPPSSIALWPTQSLTPVDSGMNRGVDNMSVGPGFGSRLPMYGGIGGLGFNPMMGPQFGMPMQGFDPYQTQMLNRKQQFDQQQFSADQMPVMGDMMYRGGPEMSRLSELQRGLARQQERLVGTRDMPLTADQKYQQAQQFGNQAYLYANSPAGRAAAARYAMG